MGRREDSQHIRQHYKSNAWLNQHIKGLFLALGMLTALTAIGTAGYVIIEGWDVFMSFYMTIITLSTVGYGEMGELSEVGRWFTSALIMAGMCVAAYSFGVIGRTALEGELNKFRGIQKMFRKISELENHYIICGYGRLARFVIPELREQGKEVVVIETDPMRIIDLEAEQIPYVEGNAYDDETLIFAGVRKAIALLAVLPSDSDNVYTTLSARNINPKIRILARNESQESEGKLMLAGANHVIAPFRISATRVVQQLLNPYVNDFLEIATARDGKQLMMEQLVIPENSQLAGTTLAESNIRAKTGVLVAATISREGQMNLSPGKDSTLDAGSTAIVLGTQESLQKFTELVG